QVTLLYPNCLFLTELHCLPWFINISESQGPGSVLQSFSFNCTSHKPTLELVRVKPSTTFFNLPSLSRRQQVYVGTVTLSSSARLDALAVNHYELQLRLTCGKHVTEGPLYVDVHRDPDYSPCAGRFASPAGEIIQVRETVTPGAQLYTLLLPGLEPQRAQVSPAHGQVEFGEPPWGREWENSGWAGTSWGVGGF
uniref:Cadherin related family member 4 n=1 Tax=Ursus americanus TaxID=9643 RepID=A0A452QS97_URSAM